MAARIREQIECLPRVQVEFVDAADRAAPLVLDAASDVIVLDLSAAAPAGFEVFKVLQPRCAGPPVVILRSRRKPEGHDSHAMTEGFQALEARLQRALGRSVHPFTWLPIRYEGRHLRAELPHSHVLVDGQPVTVSQREAELLGLLLAQVNRVVAREVIIAEIWGYETRSLDVYIRRLRRKLGPAGVQIETVTGFGYRFSDLGHSPHRAEPDVAVRPSPGPPVVTSS